MSLHVTNKHARMSQKKSPLVSDIPSMIQGHLQKHPNGQRVRKFMPFKLLLPSTFSDRGVLRNVLKNLKCSLGLRPNSKPISTCDISECLIRETSQSLSSYIPAQKPSKRKTLKPKSCGTIGAFVGKRIFLNAPGFQSIISLTHIGLQVKPILSN